MNKMDKVGWSQQPQPNPPNFGQARMVPRFSLDLSVALRRPRCRKIIANHEDYTHQKPGLISICILCCKRAFELERLYRSMNEFLTSFEPDCNVEKILVDNGSGDDLIHRAESWGFFDRIIAHPKNLGMAVALNKVFPECSGEFILLVEEDFVLDYYKPFLKACVEVFSEYPEIGLIRLKNQNNWWKPHRRIGPLRTTKCGTEFWTWLPARHWRPSRDRTLNVWAAGSVMFRKVSFCSTGPIPTGENLSRKNAMHQGYIYECIYGKRYNSTWLAAKIKDCYPFFQPNDTASSSGWGEIN